MIADIRYCTSKIYNSNFLKHKLVQVCEQNYQDYVFTNDATTRDVDVICGQEGRVRKCFIEDHIMCAKVSNSDKKELI
jgi:hypothetical protein